MINWLPYEFWIYLNFLSGRVRVLVNTQRMFRRKIKRKGFHLVKACVLELNLLSPVFEKLFNGNCFDQLRFE